MTLQNPRRLFDLIRRIKGSPLSQSEVAEVNRVLAEDGKEPPTGLRPSKAAVALIHSFEQCRLDAYPDPGSRDGTPWTIGWGSTGPGIAKGVRWTQEQADARFEQDLERFSVGVANHLAEAPTSQNQFDALVSFAYNVGLGALGDSTLLRLHKAGDFAGAAQQFGRWTKNDGKVMNGLVRRRAAEAALYRGLA